jgi:hypothetical protein
MRQNSVNGDVKLRGKVTVMEAEGRNETGEKNQWGYSRKNNV